MAGTSKKSNIGLKTVSVLLALLLWVYIANQNQGLAGQPTTGVGVHYNNLGDGLVVSGPERAAVKLWGSFGQTGDIVAYVDLHGLGEGTYQLPVRVKPVQGAMFATVQPDKVEVVLKRTTRHEFKVQYQVAQNPPPGYQLIDVVFVPDRCLVTGNEAALKKVKRVVSSLQLGNTKDNTSSKVKLVALDVNNNSIEQGIRVTPAQLEVYVVIAQKQADKKVNVVPALQGKLPEGFKVLETSVTPEAVTLRGSEELIASIDEVGTKGISLEEHRQSFSQEVEIQDLSNIKAYPARVMVDVVIGSNSEDVTP